MSKKMTEYITRQQAIDAIDDTEIELYPSEYDELSNAIKRIPATDVVEVVRCKECIHKVSSVMRTIDNPVSYCRRKNTYFYDNDFCSYGTKMDM